MTHTVIANLGRASQKLAAGLRKRIESGKLIGGDYLPTVRELCAEHQVSIDTVSRALKSLEADGLLASEPRRGYRVLARAGDPLKGFPLAYLPAMPTDPAERNPFYEMLQAALQRAAGQRGWSLLGVNSIEAKPAQVMEQLRTARVFGAILDSMNRELLALVEKAGMPAVMVDAWEEHTSLDVVAQDNYRGGYLAAEHLAGKGHHRVAWLGPVGDSPLSRERFGGACAALVSAGGKPPEIAPFDFPGGLTDEQRLERARGLLATENCPRAILALWGPITLAVARAAHERGMRLGRDLDLVGWVPEQIYNQSYAAAFPSPEEIAPAIVWSAQEMAETAIARLGQRREHPDLPALRINIPTTLKSGE